MRNKFLGIMVTLEFLRASTSNASQRTFDLDHGKGTVEFEAIGRPGALKIHGKGGPPHGLLSINGNSVSGNLTFDLESLDTGIKMRNEHMKKKYLETGKYPQARLVVTKIELPKDISFEKCSIEKTPFEGILSLHGVEKPVKGESKLACKEDQVSIDAKFGIAIEDFNITIPSFAGITMTKDVKIEVTIQTPSVVIHK